MNYSVPIDLIINCTVWILHISITPNYTKYRKLYFQIKQRHNSLPQMEIFGIDLQEVHLECIHEIRSNETLPTDIIPKNIIESIPSNNGH